MGPDKLEEKRRTRRESFFLSLQSKGLSLLIALLCLIPNPAKILRAQSVNPTFSSPATETRHAPSSPDFWANRGRWTFGGQIGFAIENGIPSDVSHVEMLVVQPQIGFIIKNFQRSPVRRFEVINEGMFGNAVHPGGRLAGYTLLLRFSGKNHGRIVPFLDVGSGVVNTTLARRAVELGGETQFTPQGGIGIEHFISPQRALVFEFRFMHMSNAGLQRPNHGFNTSMITLGFRWLRRPQPLGWQSSHHPSSLLHYLWSKL